MKQLLTLILLAVLPVVASAYDAEVDGIYYDLTGNVATVTSGDTKYSGNVEIPATFTYGGKTYIVVAIGQRAFYSCDDLTSVSIPGSVTSIGKHAFYFCGNLASITIPKSVTSIGDYAFYVCQGLSSVTLSDNLTAIGQGVFMMCTSLTSITIPNSVTSIGRNAFMECSSLASIVSKIRKPFAFGEDAFYNVPSTCVLTVPRGKRDAYIDAGWTQSVFKGGVVEDDSPVQNIAFADDLVKDICVENWDTDFDGELSMDEAADVTNLGMAFSGNTNITSFDELQYFTSLTLINHEEFKGCSALTSIAIPGNIKTFGADAFYGCSLDRVIIIDLAAWCGVTLTNRESSPLCFAQSLWMYDKEFDEEYEEEEYDEEDGDLVEVTDLVIPFGVTKINTGVFARCPVGSVTIPESVVTIDRYAFDGCYMMESLEIKNGVTTIGDWAFANCIYLTSLTIPGSVTTIGEKAFVSCDLITSLTLEEGVTTLGEEAFEGCTSLASVTIPASVTSMGYGPFCNCPNLTAIEVAAGNTHYDSRNNCNAIIETSTNALVAGCDNTVVPDGVTSIGYGAFQGCHLTSMYLPNSVTSIGQYAFAYCKQLHFITLPDNLTKIDGYAFEGCIALTSVAFPKSLTELGYSAFGYCDGLTSVTLPDNLTKMDGYVFDNCKNLIVVTLPQSLEEISSGAFHGCENLAYVVAKMQTPVPLGYYTFSRIPDECVLIVPKGTRDAYFNSQWKYEIKGGIIEEGDSPFVLFTDPEVRAICAANFDDDGDGMLTFDEAAAVTDLRRAFKDNTKITSFNELPYFTNLTQIGQSEFSGCSSLKSITIPSSITEIGQYAFANCTSLTDVWCLAEDVPSASLTSFKDVPLETATLYVPAASYNDYRKSVPWSRFGTIMTLDGTIPEVKKCTTPTISYAGGRLTFNCETEDVQFSYSIKDEDITSGTGSEVALTVTYNISVYATKDGYDDSDVAYATLCWIDAEPYSEGLTDEDAVAEVKALPVLIQSQGGIITIQGVAEGTQIDIYSIDGKKEGSAISVGGGTTISTSLKRGSVAVVKIGEKAVKVAIR